MAENELKRLQQRISDLETELKVKDGDLGLFKDEIVKLNIRLMKLIEKITAEITTATSIHKILVPTEIPNIPGFDFSTKFEASSISGGDYYDIFELENKFRFGVILSSSSNYGMSSLLLAIFLKLSGQMEAKRGSAAHKIMEMVAGEVVRNLKDSQIVETSSVFYGSVDRRRFDFDFCHVGNIEAIHFKYGADSLDRLEAAGDMFTKNFKTPLVSQTISLNPRDRVILCSPGVFDAKNASGEGFGLDRLYKVVIENSKAATHDLRNEIFYQIKKFSGEQELTRDLTVLVMEVQDRVIKLAHN